MSERPASAKLNKQIVIIGSGVIGLTSAVELLNDGYTNITIIARDMPDDSMDSQGWASPWAGANWYPFMDRDPENRWESVSWKKFKEEIPKEFIMDLPSRLYHENKEIGKDLWFKDVVGDFRELPKPWPESQGVVKTGAAFGFTTISICVPTYLPWLQSEATRRGVKFVKGWVSSLADLQYVPGTDGRAKTDVVVNASGLGAKTIIGVEDSAVQPIRGQTVVVRAPDVKWCLMGFSLYMNPEKKETVYMIPRANGDVVLGGTFQDEIWDTSPDPITARGIVERAVKYCPELARTAEGTDSSLSQIKILRHNVGLRPSRKGGPRVEKEVVKLPLPKSSWMGLAPVPNALERGESRQGIDGLFSEQVLEMRVVHAYGVGTAGYQQSWGVAADVVQLVDELLQGS